VAGERDGHAEKVGGRGIWVPDGLTGEMILAGAATLEENYDVDHYKARSMARLVWLAMNEESEKSSTSEEARLSTDRETLT
jgi:hypothetical protein